MLFKFYKIFIVFHSIQCVLIVFRYKKRKVESEWMDEESQRNSWRDLRHFELIFDLDISYKRIELNHLIGAQKKIIKIVHEDILNNYRNRFQQVSQ